MKLDRFLRLLVPSVPVLARTPLALVLDAADSLLRMGHPEWSQLPPASLRLRIGVGNQILRNYKQFIDTGIEVTSVLTEKGYFNPDSHVLELGCGCGRNAIAFARLLSPKGSYRGQDVDRTMIRWCQKNLQRENVQFFHADVFSKVYNPKGMPVDNYSFPAEDGSITLIVSLSVFSHLLYVDCVHYIRECARVLAPGGYAHMTFFLSDIIKDRLGDRWTFSHKVDRCYVESLKYPEAAVAYDSSVIEQLLNEHGLSIVELYNRERPQQTLIVQKKG